MEKMINPAPNMDNTVGKHYTLEHDESMNKGRGRNYLPTDRVGRTAYDKVLYRASPAVC